MGTLPSQCKKEHTWRTRKDPFEQEWDAIREKLTVNPGLEAKTIFDALQREQPGKYTDGQLQDPAETDKGLESNRRAA